LVNQRPDWARKEGRRSEELEEDEEEDEEAVDGEESWAGSDVRACAI
jgi:hypothetical protein